MTTSGLQEFDLDISDIIEEAYEQAGLEVRGGYDAKTARRSLNLLMTEWYNEDVLLWRVEERVVNLVVGQIQYTLDPAIVNVLEIAVRIPSGSQQTDYIIPPIPRNEYLSLPDKTIRSRPTEWYLDRQATPVLNVWPAPDVANMTLQMRVFTRLEDVTASNQSTDVIFRFLPALTAGLAYKIAMKNPAKVPPQQTAMLEANYRQLFDKARMADRERGSTRLIPAVRGRR